MGKKSARSQPWQPARHASTAGTSRWWPAASRARAARAAATRPATAGTPGTPPSSSSPGRSRGWPASATGWRCARSCRPRPRALTLAGEHAGRAATLGHRAADGLAGAGRARTARCSSACRCPAARATPTATSRDALSGRSTPSRARPIAQPARCPRPGRGCRTCSTRTRRFDVEVHAGLRLLARGRRGPQSAEVVASMERANEAAVPTVRLTSVEAAYWCRDPATATTCAGSCRTTRRPLLDALARLHALGADTVGEGLALRRARSGRTA